MSPSHPRTPRQVINFSKQKGKEIIANFDGGLITSDAGIVWIAELDKKLGITEKFGNCFQDHRHQSYVDHSVHELLAQRLYGIILGYEDVNDHDKLRHDPALKIALEKLNELEDKKG
ncbi:transposase, partial [Crocosphaera watsonii]